MSHLDESFEATHNRSEFWTLRGCQTTGYVIVDRTILRFIQNIAGTATDPKDDYYKNPKAMFEALDLIWKILEEAREGGFIVEKQDKETGELNRWVIQKISKVEIASALLSR